MTVKRPANDRRFRAVLISIGLMLLVLTGCGENVVFTTDIVLDEVFAVGDLVGTETELRIYADALQADYESAYGSDVMQGSYADEIASAVEDNALADLTKVKVLNLMAEDLNRLLEEAASSPVAARVGGADGVGTVAGGTCCNDLPGWKLFTETGSGWTGKRR